MSDEERRILSIRGGIEMAENKAPMYRLLECKTLLGVILVIPLLSTLYLWIPRYSFQENQLAFVLKRKKKEKENIDIGWSSCFLKLFSVIKNKKNKKKTLNSYFFLLFFEQHRKH